MNLKQYLEETETQRGDLAKKVGVTSYALWRYMKYKRVPASDTMAAIWKATDGKVSPNDWFAQPKKPKPKAKRKPAKKAKPKAANAAA